MDGVGPIPPPLTLAPNLDAVIGKKRTVALANLIANWAFDEVKDDKRLGKTTTTKSD